MSFPLIDENNPLILASASPRRRQLLEQIGLPFAAIPSHIEEEDDDSDPIGNTLLLSEHKARAVFQKRKRQWILGADTVVVIEKEILGQPRDEDEAQNMLGRLSGRSHEVITGFCILSPTGLTVHAEAVITTVAFKELSAGEIEASIATGEPFGKAGGYAIQGIGGFIVTGIHGSYTNVVGLPISSLVTALLGIKALASFP